MRRLAQQSRDDVYASTRDYQELHSAQGEAFRPADAGDHRLSFAARAAEPGNSNFVGAGLYVNPSSPVRIKLILAANGLESAVEAHLGGGHWNRVGVAVEVASTTDLRVDICWSGAVDISVWGLSAGPLELPQALLSSGVTAKDLNQTHLSPETFYLVQDVAIGLDLIEDESSSLAEVPGCAITLKKCSYCGRLLPLDPARLGTLAFHKHNAKRTNHQNECRACKKWRINDDFNPRRTVDQLHESSVITRERQLFLRDPERLQAIKLRTGAGLKSQVWDRFERKCFYCGKLLLLEEVQLDHTRPLAYLWPIDEYATCLCAEHNNQKTDKFPVDFYNETQMRELARITGIDYRLLVAREINAIELGRIRADIVSFARQWEPRTFAATARKVIELLPDVDLFADLQMADSRQYEELCTALAERPAGVDDSR